MHVSGYLWIHFGVLGWPLALILVGFQEILKGVQEILVGFQEILVGFQKKLERFQEIFVRFQEILRVCGCLGAPSARNGLQRPVVSIRVATF